MGEAEHLRHLQHRRAAWTTICRPRWPAFAAGSFSHSLIEDNVIYAYGCSTTKRSVNCPGAPHAPILVLLLPTEPTTSTTTAIPASCASTPRPKRWSPGHVRTGAVTQDLAAGGELFLRSVQQPGFDRRQSVFARRIVQDGAVYTYVGSENIYPAHSRRLRHESPLAIRWSAHACGKTAIRPPPSCRTAIHLPGRIQLIAGGRYDSLRDHNYSAYGYRVQLRLCLTLTDKPVWLPQYAATYQPSEKSSRSMATTAYCCRSGRKGRGGSIMAASFSRLSSRARPRWAQSTSPASAFC